jgi:hypothetical protein
VLSVVIAVTTRRDVRSARIFSAAHPADDA